MTLHGRHAAAATEPGAARAASDALADGGTALDAVLAGWASAAGSHPGVLLGGWQALFAGPGVGARAIDGRSRQPGLGVKRPRGFALSGEVPASARASVPSSLAAMALALATDCQLPLRRLLRPGIEAAEAVGASRRAAVLDRIASLGAGALHDAHLARPFVAAAGPAVGGLVTAEDLVAVRPAIADARTVGVGARRLLALPWETTAASSPAPRLVTAGDHRGVVAVLAYACDDTGVALTDTELTAPCDAVPVWRGVPRSRPGTPIATTAPLWVALDQALAVLACGVEVAQPPSLDEVGTGWREAATAVELVEALARAASGATAVGVVRVETPGGVRLRSVLVKSPVLG